ncbi:hypothetical protein PsAD2_01062 [Pseudovibrio axinellae]|uniref:Uncharacterized protein n=1 Tax=Pseudovibrio axinellae TaxID=989403 RepID=A0A166A2X4_9HYPH|nr:hypothetical protein PsAD2_01062 [Pseudovibrio axinellae]SER28856.1 hypothetical protein SAMN05421798_107315 [Pseudovibrio axinellae]
MWWAILFWLATLAVLCSGGSCHDGGPEHLRYCMELV